MSKILQVAQLGNPILYKKAEEVINSQDPLIQSLIDDLIETISDANGVGLSAPQVYASKRVIVLTSHPTPRYPQAPHMEPVAMINPKITSYSKETNADWEGCLSIPELRGLVHRSSSITVEYTDREGHKQNETYEAFIARIVQHEIDHLDGILFLDRIKSNKDLISEKEYQKMIRKSPSSSRPSPQASGGIFGGSIDLQRR